MTTIDIIQVSGTDLYKRYSGQTKAQDCYVELDCRTGRLECESNPEIGNAVPFAVHHGHVIRWSITALKAEAANKLLKKIAPLAQRVCDGYRSAWDGNNKVAHLDDDASAASEDIDALCDANRGDPSAELNVWQAADWYAASERGSDTEARRASMGRDLGITARTSDAQLVRISRIELANAQSEGVDDLENIDEYLESVRAALRAIARENAAMKAA